jgi:DNA-binding MarR family transcriptional regulator
VKGRQHPHASKAAGRGAALGAEERLELQALVPLLANHFKRAHADMPPRLQADFDAAGLGNRHGAVLARLLHAGPVTVGELARQLGLGLTNASQLVADLDHAGYVERRTDPDDRRRTLVSLQSTRRADVEKFVARRIGPLARAFEQLTVAQRRGFLAGLRAWVSEIEI